MIEKNLRDFRSVHKALNSSLRLADLAMTERINGEITRWLPAVS